MPHSKREESRPRPPEPSIAAVLIWPAIQALDAQGVDAGAVLARAGLDRAALADASLRLPRSQVYAAVDAAVAASGDRDFGLRVAERAASSDGLYGVVEFVARSSSTIGDLIRAGVQFRRLLQEDLEFDLAVHDDVAEFRMTSCDGAPVPPAWAEGILATGVLLTRKFARIPGGLEGGGLRARFAHRAPPSVAGLKRLFRVPLEFEAADYAVVMRRSHLDRPLATADPALRSVLESHASRLLEELAPSESFVLRVRRLLLREFDEGEATKERVAERLRMSARTMCRRLEAEGTTFRGVIDDLRLEIARRYLSEPGASVSEVAYVLGFRSTSAFNRAFRRWTGVSPGAFRGSRGPEGRA